MNRSACAVSSLIFLLPACMGAEGRRAGRDAAEHDVRPTGVCALDTASATIVGESGDQPIVFGSIQDAVVVADTIVVVADRSTRGITMLSPDGTTLGSFGRLGSGPGEFQSVDRVLARNDTIVVVDGRRRAYAAFTTSGRLLRDEPLPGLDRPYRVLAALADGRFLVARPVAPGVHGLDGPEVWRETMEVLVIEDSGRESANLASYEDEARISDLTEGFSVLPFPFSHKPTVAMEGNDVFFASDSVIWRIDMLTGNAVALASPWHPHPVTPDDVRQWTTDQLAELDTRALPIGRRMLRATEMPGQMPPHGPIAPTRIGTWVQEYVPPYSDSETGMALIDAEGSVLAWATLRPRTRLLAASARLVVAVRQDSLGAQGVEIIPVICEAHA